MCISIYYRTDTFEIFIPMSQLETYIPADVIQERVGELARNICTDFNDREELHIITVLEGARTFSNDLQKCIGDLSYIKVKEHFIKVSSYGEDTVSSKEIKVESDLEEDMEGKHVLIVDDIIDTGLTLRFLLNHIKPQNPKSLEIATLLDKPSRRDATVDIYVRYNGFQIPDKFVVGYGLDYAGKYRDLPYIAIGSFS